ncbi:hypothetical protein [Nevskia soli]|uniref:hypothetical protein n=1 Tax=Nevskia soli TaxID=418856 RepID=UPI0012FC5765|nr:hypothetical protein [Nevskia soli]
MKDRRWGTRSETWSALDKLLAEDEAPNTAHLVKLGRRRLTQPDSVRLGSAVLILSIFFTVFFAHLPFANESIRISACAYSLLLAALGCYLIDRGIQWHGRSGRLIRPSREEVGDIHE